MRCSILLGCRLVVYIYNVHVIRYSALLDGGDMVTLDTTTLIDILYGRSVGA